MSYLGRTDDERREEAYSLRQEIDRLRSELETAQRRLSEYERVVEAATEVIREAQGSRWTVWHTKLAFALASLTDTKEKP